MDVKIKIKIGNTIRREITTDIGIAQVDSLAALLFIFYLPFTTRNLPKEREKVDYEKYCWSELDWSVPREYQKVEIDPKYANDLTFIRSEKAKINTIKRKRERVTREIRNRVYIYNIYIIYIYI